MKNDLVKNIISKNYVASNDILENTIKAKIATKMDNFKKEIGQNYFGQPNKGE